MRCSTRICIPSDCTSIRSHGFQSRFYCIAWKLSFSAICVASTVCTHDCAPETQSRTATLPNSLHHSRRNKSNKPTFLGQLSGCRPPSLRPTLPNLHQTARLGNSHNNRWKRSALRGGLPDFIGRFVSPYVRLLGARGRPLSDVGARSAPGGV
jgi:hypothetical protein